MRKISEKTSWAAARAEVVFTDAVLDASGEHPKLLRAMRAQVERWMVIDAARQAAEDGVVRAHARVAWQDLRLDRRVRAFANELLRDAGGRADDKTFRAYFPEAPNEVIRLGLENEIERCERFATVRGKVAVSKAAAAKLAAVEEAITDGKAALKARRDAFAARTGVSLDVAGWKEASNAARESVYVQLRAWALEHGEERGYAERFFPANNSRVTVADEDEGGGGGKDEKPTG
jgi:hypothetical protein